MHEELWQDAPWGLLLMTQDGAVQEANDTLVRWVGKGRDHFSAGVTVQELLSAGGRIYWETHLNPLLRVERRLEEISTELLTAQGPLPVLLSAHTGPSEGMVHVGFARVPERTRYEAELRVARAVAQRSERRTRALQECTAALVSVVGTDNVIAALLAAALGPLGCSAARVWLTSGESDGDGHAAGEGAAGIPRPGVAMSTLHRAALDPEGRVVVPLRGHAEVQGLLCVIPPDDTHTDALGLEVFTAVGQQAGLALDRARLYEHSAQVAHELQEAMLGMDSFDDQRFEVATAYEPGVANLEVGGDWYDAFLVGDSVLALSVGDVVGRGLAAAAAMGQLRSAVRATAGLDTEPGAVLSRLDQFVQLVPDASLATVALAELDLSTGQLRYACAGHPPPLLVPSQGPPALLWEGRTSPLGSYNRPEHRHEDRVGLSPGDRVVLFTDGLIEHKSQSLDAGLDRLTAAAADLRTSPAQDIAQHLMAATFDGQDSRDDRCLLVVTWKGTQFEGALDATLAELSTTRDQLRAWLHDHGVDRATSEDLVIATSEAIANAAEHGSRRDPAAIINVRAHRRHRSDGLPEVAITVHDHGTWRPNERSHERGRGLHIISALVDEFTVREDHGTTVTLRRTLQGATP